MPGDLPAITGFQLIKLLQKDGWKPDKEGKARQVFDQENAF